VRGRPPARIACERAVDAFDEGRVEVGTLRGERRRTLLDPTGSVEQRAAPERVPAGEGFPEQHADGPDVGGGPGGIALQALG
jgi:hypothetical protein